MSRRLRGTEMASRTAKFAGAGPPLFVENRDFFCIHDEGRTELDEWRDEDGRIFTCIGFKPMEEDSLKEVVGKLQVYRG